MTAAEKRELLAFVDRCTDKVGEARTAIASGDIHSAAELFADFAAMTRVKALELRARKAA